MGDCKDKYDIHPNGLQKRRSYLKDSLGHTDSLERTDSLGRTDSLEEEEENYFEGWYLNADYPSNQKENIQEKRKEIEVLSIFIRL